MAVIFFLSLFSLWAAPPSLINPTNSKGYINVDNQFLYVSSQSLGKKNSEKEKKSKTVLFNCANVFFLTIFNVITSNLILLPFASVSTEIRLANLEI